MDIIENRTFDVERALYGRRGLVAKKLRLRRPADGESASRNAKTSSRRRCFFNLRYPSGTTTA